MDTNVIDIIVSYLKKESSLQLDFVDKTKVAVTQPIDEKSIEIDVTGVSEVLERQDSTSRPFLQINFYSGQKILLTKTLIGFKPTLFEGIDSRRIPSVVTTPDLLSIVEALSEFDTSENHEERKALKRMYFSILHGAEAIGFDLSNERLWVTKPNSHIMAA